MERPSTAATAPRASRLPLHALPRIVESFMPLLRSLLLGCHAFSINMALLTELPRLVHGLEDVAFVVQDLELLQEGQILLAERLARMVLDLVANVISVWG